MNIKSGFLCVAYRSQKRATPSKTETWNDVLELLLNNLQEEWAKGGLRGRYVYDTVSAQ
jgi:hypothetical protein